MISSNSIYPYKTLNVKINRFYSFETFAALTSLVVNNDLLHDKQVILYKRRLKTV